MNNNTFTKGDAIIGTTPTGKFVCFLKEIKGDKTYFFASYYPEANVFLANSWFFTDYILRAATKQEKQTLIEAIGKNNYHWNPSTFTLSMLDTKVPDTINLLKLSMELVNNSFGDGLVIGNNDITKLLLVRNDTYEVVLNNDYLFVKAQCHLVPCQYHELKHGDTAFMGGNLSDPGKTKFYAKILTEGYVYLDNDTPVQAFRTDYQWYKIILL